MTNPRYLVCYVCSSFIASSIAFAEPSKPDSVEASAQSLEKQIEASRKLYEGKPELFAEFKTMRLANFDAAPKFHVTIDGITVYRNATVYRYTVASKQDKECRFSYVLRSFMIGRFSDDDGREWGRPVLKSHYYFGDNYYKMNFVVEKQKATRVRIVDEFEPPNFVLLQPGVENPSKSQPS